MKMPEFTIDKNYAELLAIVNPKPPVEELKKLLQKYEDERNRWMEARK
jgi:hypothetical protein